MGGCLKAFLITSGLIGGLLCVLFLVVAVTPTNAQSHLEQAKQHYKKGNLQAAWTTLHQAFEKDSLLTEGYLLAAQLHYEANNTQAARAQIQKGLALVSSNQQAQYLMPYAQWLLQQNSPNEYTHWLDKLPFSNHQAMMTMATPLANYYHEQGHTNKAGQVFESTINRFPEQAATYHNAIDYYQTASMPQKALLMAQNLVKAIPGQAQNHMLLGNIYTNLENHNKAVGAFKKAAETDSTEGIYPYHVGISYYRLNNKKQAIQWLNKAMALGHAEACTQLREITAVVKTRFSHSVCCDGSISYSRGRGTCSHHKGVCREAFEQYKVYTMNCNTKN